MPRVLTFKIEEGSHFCCGLAEIGEFRVQEKAKDPIYGYGSYYTTDETSWPPYSKDEAFFATTTRTQTGAMKRLKRMGFKKLGTWTRDSGVKLYLWGYFPRRKKRKK